MHNKGNHQDLSDSNYVDQSSLLDELMQRYGPLVGGSSLHQLLGYPSAGAFRQAWHRRQLPIPVFSIPHRRGVYALTRDISNWLFRLRAESTESADNSGK